MRPPIIRASLDLLPGEIVADNFAGGGGASIGLEAAIGRPVDIAINHDPEAIAMHRANHPETKHFLEDIWQVDPREAAAGRPVGLAWFSPACTHFSRARGSHNPRSADIRGLAWVIIRWAEAVKPRVIYVENVEEFQTWGPLDDDCHPIKARAGEDFRAWLAKLVDLGYAVEFRSLVAADFGAPTTRKRLFLVARCDVQPIVWPEPTHGEGRTEPWRAAAEIIDWSLPCPSIFTRKRPLADATMNRIARGIQKYVIGAAQPFVIPVTHQGDSRVHGIGDPLRTITAAHRGELALVSPFVVRHGHYSHRTGAGMRDGCGAGVFRGQPPETPLATVCATNDDKHVVVPFLTRHYGGPNGNHAVGSAASDPAGTVTARDSNGLTAAWLTKFYGTSTGAPMSSPVPTVTSGGNRGGGHIAQVQAFLLKYNRPGGGKQLGLPLDTITTRDRFALVTIHGEPYQIVDIGMRMLQPSELFGAQGFPGEYDITPHHNGKPLTKTAQTRLAGNSVCPPVANAVVLANAGGWR
jgi:DNA (cytosine-5)-methyltransferase 1